MQNEGPASKKLRTSHTTSRAVVPTADPAASSFSTSATLNPSIEKADGSVKRKSSSCEPCHHEHTLRAIGTDIDAMRHLITCKICDRLLYEPFAIACGHTYCYSCLSTWVQQNRQATCPDCRADIKQQPTPNYIIREMTLIFCSKNEMLPGDETTEQHHQWAREEAMILAKDKADTHPRNGGLFKGSFRPGRRNVLVPIRDPGDGVDRCPQCHWELEDDYCEQCGIDLGSSAADDFNYADTDYDWFGHDDFSIDYNQNPLARDITAPGETYRELFGAARRRRLEEQLAIQNAGSNINRDRTLDISVDSDDDDDDDDDDEDSDEDSEDDSEDDEHDDTMDGFVQDDDHISLASSASHEASEGDTDTAATPPKRRHVQTRRRAPIVIDDDDDDEDEDDKERQGESGQDSAGEGSVAVGSRRRNRGSAPGRRPMRRSVIEVSSDEDPAGSESDNNINTVAGHLGFSPLEEPENSGSEVETMRHTFDGANSFAGFESERDSSPGYDNNDGIYEGETGYGFRDESPDDDESYSEDQANGH